MIQVINGDITKTDRDIIVQQVNCLGVMGGGLAHQLVMEFPFIREDYRSYIQEFLSDTSNTRKDLLGSVHYHNSSTDDRTVANVFGQVDIRQGVHDRAVYTVEDALIEGIERVKQDAYKYSMQSVAIPTFIGCGLGGGNWLRIKSRIEEVFADNKVNVTFYDYR